MKPRSEEHGESLGNCYRCDEPIEANDPAEAHHVDGEQRFAHWECAARMVIGGMNHLLGRCTCCGGTEPPDPPDLTKREAARHALAVFRAMRVQERNGDAA
jgi:hypothetical protein